MYFFNITKAQFPLPLLPKNSYKFNNYKIKRAFGKKYIVFSTPKIGYYLKSVTILECAVKRVNKLMMSSTGSLITVHVNKLSKYFHFD